MSEKMKETMLVLVIFVLLVLYGVMSAHAADLPDPTLTPGVARQVDQKTLCNTSTKLVRNVPESEKKAVYVAYGLSGDDRSQCAEGYEIDHLISLELGGSNDQHNLWPQLYCGTWSAHIKDSLENKLHALVCDGSMTIEAAQSCISTDWIKCYHQVMGESP